MGRGLLVGRVKDRLSAQQSWTAWLRESLPADLAGHVVHAVPRQGELVVFTDTPAWCARLRYAVAGIEQSIRQRDSSMLRTFVRVQPS
jgi:hypothetical protein